MRLKPEIHSPAKSSDSETKVKRVLRKREESSPLKSSDSEKRVKRNVKKGEEGSPAKSTDSEKRVNRNLIKREVVSPSKSSETDKSRRRGKIKQEQQEWEKNIKQLSSSDEDDIKNSSSSDDESDVSQHEPQKKIHKNSEVSVNNDEVLMEQCIRNGGYEIWTMQVPDDIDIKSLVNKSINFNETNTLDTGGHALRVSVYPTKGNLKSKGLVLRNNEKLLKAEVNGHVIVQNIRQDENLSVFQFIERDKPTFPQELKRRHPLLGAEWKTVIAQADAALSYAATKKTYNKRKRISDGDVHSNKKKKFKPDLNKTE